MKLLYSFVIILLISFQLNAQYRDFVLKDNSIYALASDGKIKIIDASNGNLTDKTITYPSKISLLTLDNSKAIVIVDEQNNIKRYNNQKNTWELVTTYKGKIYSVLFDSTNRCYVITNKGIEDVFNRKTYFSNKSLNHGRQFSNGWGEPTTFYIDKNYRIWLGWAYGEWGGNLIIFDTKIRKFEAPKLGSIKMELWPVTSFFEDKTSVYLSSGLSHMNYFGAIFRFDNFKASTVVENISLNSIIVSGTTDMKNDEDIRYGTFNKYNNSIYFYSQSGFFKGEKTKDLSKTENWKFIAKPKLQIFYQSNGTITKEVLFPMVVWKMEIIDKDKFIFLSQKDGIGYYDGKKIIMIP